MNVEDKIALCAIKHHEESHIQLDQDKCRDCETRVCVKACPGHLYSLEDESELMKVDHSGCLECGTCFVICPLRAVTWKRPEPGYGIRYRYG